MKNENVQSEEVKNYNKNNYFITNCRYKILIN